MTYPVRAEELIHKCKHSCVHIHEYICNLCPQNPTRLHSYPRIYRHIHTHTHTHTDRHTHTHIYIYIYILRLSAYTSPYIRLHFCIDALFRLLICTKRQQSLLHHATESRYLQSFIIEHDILEVYNCYLSFWWQLHFLISFYLHVLRF